MKSFFIPIYLKLGKLSEEKLLVALIAVTPEKVIVKYSQKRIHLSSEVVNHSYSQLAKEILDQIQNKANEVNLTLSKVDQIKFENIHIFNTEYFEYLQKYSQNTLLFGAIEYFNFNNTEVGFYNLYESLMNEKILPIKEIKTSFHTKIKTNLKASGIEDKVDIEYKISSNKLAGLYNDMIITLISKNGSVFAVEAIDFNNGIPALTNSLNAFDVLVNSLNQYTKKNNLKAGHYHILNSVPVSGSEQEKLLNNIFKNKKDLYEVVSEDSIEKITNEIKSGTYKKFSLSL